MFAIYSCFLMYTPCNNIFPSVHTLLYSAHMQDLQEITHEVHYENFRSEKMAAGSGARKIKSVLMSFCLSVTHRV